MLAVLVYPKLDAVAQPEPALAPVAVTVIGLVPLDDERLTPDEVQLIGMPVTSVPPLYVLAVSVVVCPTPSVGAPLFVTTMLLIGS
jgi:hypothetical protein